MAGIRDILGKLTGRVASESVGFAVGTAAAPILAPVAREFEIRANETRPNLPLDPAAAANAVVQGELTREQGAAEAKKSGIDGSLFETLVGIAGLPPGPTELMEMYRRGRITEDRMIDGILRGHTKLGWEREYLKLIDVPLSPAEAAEMVIRSVITEAEGQRIAKENGIAPEDFSRMVEISGSPPGLEMLVRALRRKIIDEGQFVRGVRQSRLRNEWTDTVKELAVEILTPEQLVNAVVQGAISKGEAQGWLERVGLDQQSFDILVETRGNPPGPEAMLRLFRRGKVTRAELEQSLRESNLKNKWIDTYLESATLELPREVVTTLLRHGELSDDQGIAAMQRLGYSEDDAKLIVAAAHSEKNAADKDLTKSEIVRLYSEGAIGRDDAAGMLGNLGYDSKESDFLLTISDFQRVARFLNAAIGRVHTQFVNHRIDVDVVTTALDRLQVPSDQRENLIDLWTEERAANVKILTAAEVAKAAQLGFMEVQESYTYLQNLGYSARDAAIYLNLHKVSIDVPA